LAGRPRQQEPSGTARCPARPAAEESPDSTEQGGCQQQPGVTRGTVPQRNRPPVFVLVRVKRCGKSAPALRVTGAARQTPPGARSKAAPVTVLLRRCLRAARPSLRVDRSRPPVTVDPDGWSPASARTGHRIRLTRQLVRPTPVSCGNAVEDRSEGTPAHKIRRSRTIHPHWTNDLLAPVRHSAGPWSGRRTCGRGVGRAWSPGECGVDGVARAVVGVGHRCA